MAPTVAGWGHTEIKEGPQTKAVLDGWKKAIEENGDWYYHCYRHGLDVRNEKDKRLHWLGDVSKILANPIITCSHGNTLSMTYPDGSLIEIQSVKFKCGCYIGESRI